MAHPNREWDNTLPQFLGHTAILPGQALGKLEEQKAAFYHPFKEEKRGGDTLSEAEKFCTRWPLLAL